MIPKLTIKRGFPGEIFVVDECGHAVAAFRAKTPDCHTAPYAEPEYACFFDHSATHSKS